MEQHDTVGRSTAHTKVRLGLQALRQGQYTTALQVFDSFTKSERKYVPELIIYRKSCRDAVLEAILYECQTLATNQSYEKANQSYDSLLLLFPRPLQYATNADTSANPETPPLLSLKYQWRMYEHKECIQVPSIQEDKGSNKLQDTNSINSSHNTATTTTGRTCDQGTPPSDHMSNKESEYDEGNTLSSNILGMIDNNKGVCLAKLKQYKESMKCLHSAIAINQHNMVALVNCTVLHVQHQQYAKALVSLDSLLMYLTEKPSTDTAADLQTFPPGMSYHVMQLLRIQCLCHLESFTEAEIEATKLILSGSEKTEVILSAISIRACARLKMAHYDGANDDLNHVIQSGVTSTICQQHYTLLQNYIKGDNGNSDIFLCNLSNLIKALTPAELLGEYALDNSLHHSTAVTSNNFVQPTKDQTFNNQAHSGQPKEQSFGEWAGRNIPADTGQGKHILTIPPATSNAQSNSNSNHSNMTMNDINSNIPDPVTSQNTSMDFEEGKERKIIASEKTTLIASKRSQIPVNVNKNGAKHFTNRPTARPSSPRPLSNIRVNVNKDSEMKLTNRPNSPKLPLHIATTADSKLPIDGSTTDRKQLKSSDAPAVSTTNIPHISRNSTDSTAVNRAVKPSATTHPKVDLISPGPYPPDVDVLQREIYLNDQDFHQLLGMSQEVFAKLPKWKQVIKKKSCGLF